MHKIHNVGDTNCARKLTPWPESTINSHVDGFVCFFVNKM